MRTHAFLVTLTFVASIHVRGQQPHPDPGKEGDMETKEEKPSVPAAEAIESIVSRSSSSSNSNSNNHRKDAESPPPTFQTEKPRPQTNYSEARFASLFPSKSRRPRLPPVRHTTKAKPTLPPFIKNQPVVRITTEEPVMVTRSSIRSVRTTARPTSKTTTTTSRSRNRGRESPHVAPTTESPNKRRRFGSTDSNSRNMTRTRSRS